jgi:hypothetical protein
MVDKINSIDEFNDLAKLHKMISLQLYVEKLLPSTFANYPILKE